MLLPISLEPSVPYQFLSSGERSSKPPPGLRSERWDACIQFPSLAFPFGERDYLQPSFDMDRLLAWWPLLLLVSLVTCKVWSFDLYLKKLPYITVTQNSMKHPCSTRDLGPRVLLSLSLSLSLADSLERGGLLRNPGHISLFPSLTFLSSNLDHQVPVH